MRLPIDKLPKPLSSVYNWFGAVFKEYNEDNGGIVAAAISFYVFISIIPLALVAVAIFGYVLGSQDQSRELLLRSIRQALPGAGTAQGIQRLVGGIIAGSAPAGIVGILLLLWSGSSVFVNLGQAMNIAWDAEDERGFFKGRLVAVGMLFSAGLLLLISFGLTTGAGLLARQELFGLSLSRLPFFWEILGYLIPPIITIAMFTLIYKLLPAADVPFKAALVGGIAAGIVWEILKIAFTFYLTNFANYGAIYGSLATVIVLVFWIFYSSIIAVLGAEFSQVYARRVMGVVSEEEMSGRREAA